ncbi:MAG: hypothetical protein K2H01_02330 [Ruminococcus sp.]|nr:hypothetical protein [Ruminococcus sp.]
MIVYVLWGKDVTPEDFKVFADGNEAQKSISTFDKEGTRFELIRVYESDFDFFVETENNFYQVYNSADRTFAFFKHKKEAYDFAIAAATQYYKIPQSYADDSFTQIGFCGGIFVDPMSFYDRGGTFGVDTNGYRIFPDEYYKD